MNINKFMFKLNNVLYENFFTNVKLYIMYNDSVEVTIRVICERNNKNYDFYYNDEIKFLDSKKINDIVYGMINN